MAQNRRLWVLMATITVIMLLLTDFLCQYLGHFRAFRPRNQSTEGTSIGVYRLPPTGSVNQDPTRPIPGGCGILKETLSPSSLSSSSSSRRITPDCNSSAFLVYVCGQEMCGGLGDRLKGIVSTFLLALLTNRTFVLLHSKPCSLTESLVPNHYDWTHCTENIASAALEARTFRFIDGRFVRSLKADSLKTIEELLEKRLTYIRTNENIVREILEGNHGKLSIPPEFYSPSCYIDSDILNILFKPSKQLSTDIQSFTRNNNETTFVCAHIRVGKNPTIPRDVSRALNTSEMLRFLDTYNHSNRHTIFVATDAEEVRHQVLGRYSNAVSTGRQIVHVDRFQPTGQECGGLYTAVMEMQLLSRCDILLLCDSGFGVKAAELRATSDNLFCYRRANNTVIPCRYDSLDPSLKKVHS